MQKLIDDFEASWDVSGDEPLPNRLLLILILCLCSSFVTRVQFSLSRQTLMPLATV